MFYKHTTLKLASLEVLLKALNTYILDASSSHSCTFNKKSLDLSSLISIHSRIKCGNGKVRNKKFLAKEREELIYRRNTSAFLPAKCGSN